jgi:hypothetical protein
LVLYGQETWSLLLREEHRLRVFKNRVPRCIFGPKRVRVPGGRKKVHNEELRNLYFLPSIVRMMRSKRVGLAGHVSMNEELNVYTFLVGKLDGKSH